MQQGTVSSRARGIDGLRTLCIASIILYHLNLPWLPSGHMGVVIFLVLSGYFGTLGITHVLDRKGSFGAVDLLRSWGKRIARIVPSVIALVAIVGTLCAAFSHVLLTKMRPDVIPSLGFFLNWSYILRDVSYFDMIGGTSPLLHLWYIGVDLQFFLAWSLILAVLLKIGKGVARKVTLLLAIASAVLMAVLYVPGQDPSRVYYGTDTRAFALLLGSWLALTLPLGKMPETLVGRLFVKRDATTGEGSEQLKSTIPAHLLGLVCCAGLVAAMIMIPADSKIWYQGGMAGFALVATIFTATLVAPQNLLGKLLGLAPFRVLGARSFALYLWHYPIILLMDANKSTTVWWMRLAAVCASFVAAEISLRFVERPFGPRSVQVTKRKSPDETVVLKPTRPQVVMAITTLAVTATGICTYQALKTIPDESLVPEDVLVSTGVSAGQAMDLSDATKRPDGQGNNDGQGAQPSETPNDAAPAQVEVTDSTVVHASGDEVGAGKFDPVLIGDSVPGDAGNEFVADNGGWEGRLPDGHFDSFIGRRPDQALDVLNGYLEQGVVGNVVVLACFSNSTPYPDTLQAMVDAVGQERQLYLVGTVNPDGFQEEANANLQEVADKYENVHYVDWPAVLEGHMDEYLWADATHLRPEGAAVYVDMVVRAVAQSMVNTGGSTTEG